MKKKLLTLVCIITCLFGLTACGSEEAVSEYQQYKLDTAEEIAPEVVALFTDYLCTEDTFSFDGLTSEEIEYLCEQYFGMKTDGNAMLTGVQSFSSGLDVIGAVEAITDVRAEADGKSIVVEVDIAGTRQNATAEIILSNDMFSKLESASLNPTASFGSLMAKAGMNTLIGMGTVFAVLILISLIISCFGFIPKLQNAIAKSRDKKKAEKENTGIDNAVAQIAAREEVNEETDDLELVAVIAAAIAASEGASSTDGFIVRSIRRRA